MKTLQMYVELQALVTLFLVAFFWALQLRLERNAFFRFWTLGWMCFGGYLLIGSAAMRIEPPHTAIQTALIWTAVLLGYLQIPLIFLGAQSLLRRISRRRTILLVSAGAALALLLLAASYVLPLDPTVRYTIRSTPRQLGFAAVYLYCAYLFLKNSRTRPSRLGAQVTALSCLVGGSIQLMFAWSGVQRLWLFAIGSIVPAISRTASIDVFWLNLDVGWECGVALGMVLFLLEDYQAANRLLRASEEKFSTAFRSSPDMISLSRVADGKELEVNDAFLKLTGYSREEALGRTASDLNMWVRPEDRDLFLTMLRHARQVRDLEVPFRRKDSTMGAGLVSAEVILVEGTECLLTVTRDITARKRDEEALRWIARGTSSSERSQFFADIVRHLAEALQVRYTIVTECVDGGKARVRALALWDGEKIERGLEYDVQGTPCAAVMKGEFCHFPKDVAALFPEDAVLEEMGVVGYVGVPLLDSAGQVIGHFAILDDKPVSDSVAHSTTLQIFAARAGAELERETGERALRASESNYRELIENANDIIYTHDLHGTLFSWNKAGERITGLARHRAIGTNVFDLVAPEHREMARRALREKLQGVPEATYSLEILTTAGQRVPLELSTRVILQEEKPVAIQGIARDVSERRSLEDQLRQAQKMEAIGRLAGGVAHDFNNLLMVICGYSDLVLERLGPEHPARRSIERIANAGEKATSLTRQLLAFSRKQVLQPRVLDLNVLLLELSKMLPPLIREDIEFVVQPGARPGKVKADPTQLEQVVINLVVNARDAMPRGGKLTIETDNVRVEPGRSAIHPDMLPGDYVVLAVSDTGVGMDSETQKRVFEPFFTTKPQGHGTGLGLATVYGIVKQSGGYIWLYSEAGRGSNFKIYLPQVDGPAAAPEQVSAKRWPAGSETILVVEDDDNVRELTAEFLSACGYQVLEASQANRALEICREFTGPIHVLVTDIVMPGMSGPDLAQAAAKFRPQTRVLFVSGYSDDAVAHHGLIDSNAAFLEKPFTHSALAERIRSILDRVSTETFN